LVHRPIVNGHTRRTFVSLASVVVAFICVCVCVCVRARARLCVLADYHHLSCLKILRILPLLHHLRGIPGLYLLYDAIVVMQNSNRLCRNVVFQK